MTLRYGGTILNRYFFRLNPSAINIQQAIADFKTCPLDEQEEKRIQKEIEQWKDYEGKVDRLEENVNLLKAHVDDIEKSQQEGEGKIDQVVDFFKAQQKQIQDLLVNLGNERNITRKIKVFDSVLEVKGDAIDEPTINWLENLVKIACNVRSNTNCPEEDKELQTKLIEFVSKTESATGAKIIDASKACIIIKFSCESKEQLLNLLHYFESESLKYQLEELAEIVKRRIMTEDCIQLSFQLSRNCLKNILEEIAEKDIASSTALKTEKEKYLQRRKDLKDDMITFYNTRHSKVSPLESFYPRPVKIEKMLATKHGIQQVESLSDMFKSKSTIIREIYTTSYDGSGKKTFSKYIAITWCQAHCSKDKEKDKASFEKDDIDCMHGFEFVFIVLLQDSYDLFSIDNLIFELIVSKLARSEKFDGCFLQEILNREKCLVILDGLDELTLPEDPGKPTSGTPRSILHRNDRKRYIIFSLTRPWTLGVLNPRSSMALGKLAYHTFFNNKLILDRSLAQKYLNEGDMKLSFLLEILTESQTEPVSFSEEKVQEFFAATFISSQSDGKKIVLKNCNSVQDILDMSTICQFISKMNATMMCEISEGFMSVINEYEETRVNRIRTEDVYLPLYHLQNMLVSCLKEMPENENIQMCLQDMFISCHSEQDLKGLSKVNKSNIKSLYIDSSETSRSLREIIELYSLIDLNYLQKLYFIGNAKDADLNRLLSQCLQSLSLSWGKWTTCKENLSEQLEQMQNLQYLYICAFTFSHKILELFLNSISSKRTLKEVTLTQIYCNEHGDDCERMKLDLSQHFQLKEVKLFELPPLELNIKTPSLVDVELSSINLDESSLLLSPEMLNFESVMLTDLEMSAESLQNDVNVLENLPHSVEVVINECRIGPETERKLFENYILNAETFDVKVDDYLYGWNFVFNTRKPSKEYNNIKK